MEICFDEFVYCWKDMEEFGIGVGDFVLFDFCVEIILSGFIKLCYLDDKVSVVLLFCLIY